MFSALPAAAGGQHAELVWMYRVKPSLPPGGAALWGGYAVAADSMNVLHFIALDSGRRAWSFAFTDPVEVYDAAAGAGGGELLVVSGKWLHLVSPARKMRLWTHRMKKDACEELLVSDAGEAAVRYGGRSFELLALRTGKLLSAATRLKGRFSPLAKLLPADGAGADMPPGVRWENGAVTGESAGGTGTWKFSADAPLVETAAVWRGDVFTLDGDGKVYRLKPGDGSLAGAADLTKAIDMRFWDERPEFINDYSNSRLYARDDVLLATVHSGIARVRIMPFPAVIRLKDGGEGATDEWALERAIELWEKGRFREALERFESASRIFPGSAVARLFMGMAHAAMGATDDAIAELEKAHELDPLNADVISNLYGNYVTKILSLDPAVSPGELKDLYRKAIAVVPEARLVYIGLAEVLFAGGEYGEAEKVLLDSLEHGFMGVDQFTLLLCAGYLQRKDEEALRTAHETLLYFPDAKYVHEIRGKIFCRHGGYADCLSGMEKGAAAGGEGEVSLFPAMVAAGAGFYLANAAGLTGDYRRAVRLLKSHLEKLDGYEDEVSSTEDPQRAMILRAETEFRLPSLFSLAHFYYRIGDRAGSLKRLEEIEKSAAAGDAETQSYLGYFLALNGERLDDALELTGNAAAREPERAAFLRNHAVALWKNGRLEEAEELFRRAAAEGEDTEFLHYDYGTMLVEMGRKEEGTAEIRKEVELNPELAAARIAAGLKTR
ncbi:MAG: tetratricopeptide repeat protein [bacterium]